MSRTQSEKRLRLFNLHPQLCKQAYDLMQRKNADYGCDGPFDNFMLAEALKICSAEKGIILRMGDKLSRLSTVLTHGAQVKEETVKDTILDLINYSVLLLALLESNNNVCRSEP